MIGTEEVAVVARKPYPSDVGDEEWALVVPYLAPLPEDVPQRTHSLREVFNALRWLVRAGAALRAHRGRVNGRATRGGALR